MVYQTVIVVLLFVLAVRCAENGGGPIAFMGFPFEGYAKYAGVKSVDSLN